MKDKLKWSVDTPALLKEICDCSLSQNNRVVATSLTIFQSILAELAERAIELNDLKLHILMIRLNLYELKPHERVEIMERLQKESEEME